MIHLSILTLAVLPTEQIYTGVHVVHIEVLDIEWRTSLSPSQPPDWTDGSHL